MSHETRASLEKDEFRAIVHRDGPEIVIGSRTGKPLTRYFPELVAAL